MEKLASLPNNELLARYVDAFMAMRNAKREEEKGEAVKLHNDLFFELMGRMEK